MNSLYYSEYNQLFFYFLNEKVYILSRESYTKDMKNFETSWREGILNDPQYWTNEWQENSVVIEPEKYLTHPNEKIRNFIKNYLEKLKT